MNIITPGHRDLKHPNQIKKYSASLRLWHWLNATVITGSLLTVLLNSTLLKTRKNAVFIQGQLQEAGLKATDKQARAVAHGLSDKIWELHTYFGYFLCALVSFRIMLEFFQIADQRVIRKIRTAYHNYYVIKKQRELAKHDLAVKTLYAVFYLMIIIMILTGLCLAFEDDVPALKAIHAFREIHQFTMYLILGFIIMHIIGVYWAERKDSKGIVSDMINGGGEK